MGVGSSRRSRPPITRPPRTGGGVATLFEGASNITISGGTFIAATGGNVHITTAPPSTTVPINTETVEELLAQIPENQFRIIHCDNFDKHVPGSGLWFLESAILQDWLHGRSFGKILWVVGDAGTGKTILASIVIDYLEQMEHPASETEPGTAVAYVYCRYTEKMSVTDLLVALVRQQLERHPSLAPLIKPVFAKHQRENSKPSQQELLTLLNAISYQLKVTFYVLDALDEAPHDVRFDIIQALALIDARIFITSRPLGHLELHFAAFTTFTTVKAHKSDIDLLVNNAIARDPDFAALLHENGVREEISNAIYDKCGGMFLHAALQLRALQRCPHIDDLRDTLMEFPPNIVDFYVQCWGRLNGQSARQVQLAKVALSCILAAKRDLTLEELQCAISYDPQSRRFRAVTSAAHLLPLFCGLVTIDKESTLVRLVHYTAVDTIKERLESDPLHSDLHAHLASACIAHLAKHNFQHFDIEDDPELRVLKKTPFLTYAYENWSFHSHQSSSQSAGELCANFILNCKTFPLRLPFDQCAGLSAIHVTAHYNFPDILRHLPTLRADINQVDSNGESALIHAASEGDEDVVRVLLDVEGISVNLVDGYGNSALIRAAWRGHEAIVRLLLAVEGIAVNQADRSGNSALIRAAWNGHEAIVRLLLDAEGIAVNQASKFGISALMRAAWKGRTEIVRLLLAADGIAVNLHDSGTSALIRTVVEGHEDVVRLLLGVEGIAVNVVDEHENSPLMRAVKGGHEGIVRLLLGVEGIAVGFVNAKGESALTCAERRGHEGILRLLRDREAT